MCEDLLGCGLSVEAGAVLFFLFGVLDVILDWVVAVSVLLGPSPIWQPLQAMTPIATTGSQDYIYSLDCGDQVPTTAIEVTAGCEEVNYPWWTMFCAIAVAVISTFGELVGLYSEYTDEDNNVRYIHESNANRSAERKHARHLALASFRCFCNDLPSILLGIAILSWEEQHGNQPGCVRRLGGWRLVVVAVRAGSGGTSSGNVYHSRTARTR